MDITPPRRWTIEEDRDWIDMSNEILANTENPFNNTSIGFKIDKWDERVSRMREGSNGLA